MNSNTSKTSCKRGFTQDVMLNSFQHLHLNQPSFKAEEALNKGSFRAPLRFGFTLIELLVVVLIIGILAAVAVPQYQKAVLKSRVSTILPVLDALVQAEERYSLANGQYSGDVTLLDIEMPGNCLVADSTGDAVGGWKCGDFYISSAYERGSRSVYASYCPGYADSYVECSTHRTFQIGYGTSRASFSNWVGPNQRRCLVQNSSSQGEAVCKALGPLVPGTAVTYEIY